MEINDKFDSEIIKAIHEINDALKGKVVFAGSFGLKYYGYLNRMIKDLDVFTFEDYYATKDSIEILHRDSSGVFTVNGKKVFCVKGYTTNDISVDYFYKEDVLEYNIVNFHGVDIKIEDPKHAIKAKEEYAANTTNEAFNIEKHKNDLFYIYALSDENTWGSINDDDLPF